MGATNIWSYTLTDNTLNIVAADNVVRISVLCKLGSIVVSGSGLFKGLASDPVSLSLGQGVTLTASGVGNPIDGVVISAETSGDVGEVIISRS